MSRVTVVVLVLAALCGAVSATESADERIGRAMSFFKELTTMDVESVRRIVHESGLAAVVEAEPVTEAIEPVGSGPYLPVVQMHGMGDFAENPMGMVPLAKMISKRLNGTYVVNIPIGATVLEDILDSFILNLVNEVKVFTAAVRNDSNLAGGFNAVGYSQGNLIIRGYIEMVNDPPIRNWISVHGPLSGVAGFPQCNLTSSFCKGVADLLGDLAYNSLVQSILAQANYFRHPLMIPQYLANDVFLADVNNERATKNATYAQNFASLQHMAFVRAMGDTMVWPSESEWWGFYEDGSQDVLLPMNETSWFKGDYFGLQTMYNGGRVHFYHTPGNHLQFTNEFLLSLVDQYLTN